MANDTELLDWQDNNGVQTWPEKRAGLVVGWTAQVAIPFIQVTQGTLRLALWAAKEKFEAKQ